MPTARKFTVQGAFSGKVDDRQESLLPRFRRRTTSNVLDADYVYGIAHKVHPEWLVICPGRWWSVMDDEFFGENFVASNAEARKVSAKIMERRPGYKVGYLVNQVTAQ